jgi:hypothetical protein
MDDDFPTSSAPQYSVGEVVKYFDTYLKKDVTGVIVGKERPLGFNIYTVRSRYDGRESRMLTHNLLSVKGILQTIYRPLLSDDMNTYVEIKICLK